MYKCVCARAFFSPGRCVEVRFPRRFLEHTPFLFPDLSVSLVRLASWEPHGSQQALSQRMARSCSSSRTLRIPVLCPVTGKESGGGAVAETRLQGLFCHLCGTNVSSSHFLPAGNRASDSAACPNAFVKWITFLVFWFKLKFPSPAGFYCKWNAEYRVFEGVLYRGAPPSALCMLMPSTRQKPVT